MDKNKLEISGKNSPEALSMSATYKPIPERDMEEQALSRPKSLVKESGSTVTDGADEKMLPSDDKVPEVVVFGNDTKSPQNGDAKLDIVEAKQDFKGLTKEELMKYANDPFWVRLRWFLFVSFWLLWASMLIGAVLIIYAAPKCDPPPPRNWYQQGPLSEISDQSELNTLDENVQGVIVPWNIDVYEPLENNPAALELIKAATTRGSKVIVEVDPTGSNVWFAKSEKKEPNFDGFYIWRPITFKGAETTPVPPNNWVGPNNESSWKISPTRNEYYYTPFDLPHLNFRNDSVVEEFSKVINRFLAVNVTGIRLRHAAFLLVDPLFENEEADSIAKPGLSLTQYGFFKHSKTEDLPELGKLLKEWRRVLRNKTEDAPLMVAEELGRVNSYKVNDSLVVDMPLQSHVFSKPILSVDETANHLNYTFNIDDIEWPLWKAKTGALPRDALDILTYLLPGAPLINASEPVSPVLLKIRDSPSIMRGMCGVYSLQNNTILAVIRVTPGSPGILVAVNPTNSTAIADVPAEIPLLSNLQEVTIRYFSSNYNETNFKDVGGKRVATAVPVSPRSAIVLEYVPKKDE